MSCCPDEDQLVDLLDLERAAPRTTLAGHLDRCARCRETVAAVVALEPHQGHDPLGRYQLERPLGAGAMGLVWAAWDPELERRVAIKLVRAERDDATARAWLLREARALARLQHPNVLAVYDLGRAGGELFIVTELVDGDTIGAWQIGRPWQQVVEAYLQAARGVAAAHAAGLIHRDLKPDNILVGRDGRVRVGDFGLAIGTATDEGATAVERPRLPLDRPRRAARGTEPGTVVAAASRIAGTPAYMAPEQHTSTVIDARADQYGLALALTEALLGRRVPAGVSAGTISMASTEWIPRPLAVALARGLETEPAARFTSVDAFIAAVEASLAAARPHPSLLAGVVTAPLRAPVAPAALAC
ncbi:MAG: serine/threonine protein kinase [Kofleriaceae bacterium]|nr:serine/threonine protein kinase [Kofleriaceae bacterium]